MSKSRQSEWLVNIGLDPIEFESYPLTLIGLTKSEGTIDWHEEEAYEVLLSQLSSSFLALRKRSSGGKYDASSHFESRNYFYVQAIDCVANLLFEAVLQSTHRAIVKEDVFVKQSSTTKKTTIQRLTIQSTTVQLLTIKKSTVQR